MADIAEFFAQVPEKANKEKMQDMNCTYQFNITGDGGGQWYIVIDNGTATVHEGTAENPNTTVTMEASNFVNLLEGKLNGQMAFMTGKLKVNGDIGLATKLKSVFNLG